MYTGYDQIHPVKSKGGMGMLLFPLEVEVSGRIQDFGKGGSR